MKLVRGIIDEESNKRIQTVKSISYHQQTSDHNLQVCTMFMMLFVEQQVAKRE